MARTNDLFLLIKSLKKSEKRYFKLNAKSFTSKSNYYLKLFDLIDKQEEYDEERLLFYFKKKSIRLDFPSLKVYLYDLILRCLRNYYSENDKYQKCLNLLSNALLLKERNLELMANKMFKKALKLASDNMFLKLKALIEENISDKVSIEKAFIGKAELNHPKINAESNKMGLLGEFDSMETFNTKISEYLPKKYKKPKPKLFEVMERNCLKSIYAAEQLESLKNLDKLIDVYGHMENLKPRIINLELTYAIRFKKFEKLNEWIKHGPKDYNFKFKSITALLYCKQYDTALSILESLNRNPEIKLYSTQNSILSLFKVYLLYKNQQTQEFKKALVEAYLFIKGYEGRSKTEDCYMHGLKGLIRASSQKDLIKNIFKTIYELQILKIDRLEKDVFLLFDFIDLLQDELEIIKLQSKLF